MDEIELRFEALQRHLQARRMNDAGLRARLQAEGDLLSVKADMAMIARIKAGICNDDVDSGRAA